MEKEQLWALLLILLLIARAGADQVSLSGVDPRSLAVRGRVNLYVVVTDDDGSVLTDIPGEGFRICEAPGDGELEKYQRITGFSSPGLPREGTVFMLLIDDSGSMYDGPNGRPSPAPDQTRAALARREARRFLEGLGSSPDRVGLALFHTRYRVLAGPRTDRGTLIERLGVSSPPQPKEAYTELYAGITGAAETLAGRPGRRIVILFSDGNNYPYARHAGRPHPEYGEKNYESREALETLQREGVTLYAVRFGANKDEALAEIALSTGGLVFDVDGEEALAGLYASIRARVAAEYRLSYRPAPTAGPETNVRVELTNGLYPTATLSYPSLILFGTPIPGRVSLFSLSALAAALLIVVFLHRMPSAEKVLEPSLWPLHPMGGRAATDVLGFGKTLILTSGPGESIRVIQEAANGATADSAVTVERGSDGQWRVSSPGGVMVNNRWSEERVLENGDVIRAGDELIVFDDGKN